MSKEEVFSLSEEFMSMFEKCSTALGSEDNGDAIVASMCVELPTVTEAYPDPTFMRWPFA